MGPTPALMALRTPSVHPSEREKRLVCLVEFCALLVRLRPYTAGVEPSAYILAQSSRRCLSVLWRYAHPVDNDEHRGSPKEREGRKRASTISHGPRTAVRDARRVAHDGTSSACHGNLDFSPFSGKELAGMRGYLLPCPCRSAGVQLFTLACGDRQIGLPVAQLLTRFQRSEK